MQVILFATTGSMLGLSVIGVLTAATGTEPGNDLLTLCLAKASPLLPAGVWHAWSFAPAVVIPLVAAGAGYATWAAKARAERDTLQRASFFVFGLLLVAIAVVSPLCRMAATLASAHMVQHVILVALAPPMLVLGLRRDASHDSESSPRRFLPSFLRHPGFAAALYGVLIWLWHVPRFYEAALVDAGVHITMYASLIAAAVIFWSSIAAAGDADLRSRAWAVPALLVTFIHTGLLGALLTFAPSPWYPLMSPGSMAWGLTPLEDQQLAGLIMWVPMGSLYILAALWVVGSGLAKLDAMTPKNRD